MGQPSGHVQLQMKIGEQEEFQLQLLGKSQTQIQDIKIIKIEPDDDPEALLLAFESLAAGSLFPKEQWATQLPSLLSVEAQAPHQALPNRTTGKCDHLKSAIRDHSGASEENYRQKFRSLTFTTGTKPRVVARQLRDWGGRWLKPEIRSPAEILELIIVEQFIQILPASAGEWLSHHQVQSLDRAVQLIEDYLATEDFRAASEDCISDVLVQVWDETEQSAATGLRNQYTEGNHKECPANHDLLETLPGTAKEKDLRFSQKREASERQNKPQRKQKNPADNREYLCTECGKSFTSNSNLINHHRIHTGEKPYMCTTCGKSFRRSTHLIAHQLIHSGEKPYTCNECGKHFRESSHLRKHQRIHERFRQPSYLITHQHIQIGETPHACSEYGKSFRQSTEAITRQKLHGQQRLYICSECGKSFHTHTHILSHQLVCKKETQLGDSAPAKYMNNAFTGKSAGS